eukprot:1979683-Amphidinium_carterae.1
MDDAMEVDSNPAPRPPPPGAKPGRWNSDGEWVVTEDDPIPAWALEMDAPKSPIVYDPETSFAESEPL